MKSERSTSSRVENSSLVQAYGQSARIHDLIKQATAHLSSSRVQQERSGGALTGIVTSANSAANESALELLREASLSLATVNQNLQIAIRDRTLIDHQLAAAVEQEQGARNAALHDQLTGLANRVLFMDRLEHGIAQAKRHQWILAVLFVDLDDFKNINDTYGHQTGDAVLQAVAKRLAHNARVDDTVSRYGGDEFLCLLTPLQEHKDIPVIAAKILKALREPYDVPGSDVIVNVGASIGISVFARDGDSTATLISRADEAMYEAKQNKSGFAFAP